VGREGDEDGDGEGGEKWRGEKKGKRENVRKPRRVCRL